MKTNKLNEECKTGKNQFLQQLQFKTQGKFLVSRNKYFYVAEAEDECFDNKRNPKINVDVDSWTEGNFALLTGVVAELICCAILVSLILQNKKSCF